MISDKEQIDAAERNILYLKELKSLILVKTQLLKLKLNDDDTNSSNYSIDTMEEENKNLIKDMLTKTNLDNTIFYTILKLFITDNIINNESEDVEFQAFKQKFYKSLEQLNKSTNNIQASLKQLKTLTNRYKEMQQEFLHVTSEHDKLLEKHIQTEKEQNKQEHSNELKEQIIHRIEKINLMITIINGLIYNINGANWADDPELQEIAKKCRSMYIFK